MIHSIEDRYGDFDVYLCAVKDGTEVRHPQDSHIGTLEQGRKLPSWTEWQFVPDAPNAAKGPVQKSYVRAREDARMYATTLEPSHV